VIDVKLIAVAAASAQELTQQHHQSGPKSSEVATRCGSGQKAC
jgi:hypothetical protein